MGEKLDQAIKEWDYEVDTEACALIEGEIIKRIDMIPLCC